MTKSSKAVDPMVLAQTSLSARARWAAKAPISVLMQQALENPDLISLAAGFVDPQSLPAAATSSAAASLLADPVRARAALQYGATAGDTRLREQILERLVAQDAADAAGPAAQNTPSLEQVILTAGSNQLLSLLVDALLDPGDAVLCDAPSYFVFTGLVQSAGARCLGVATDAQGMRLDSLEQILEQHAAAGTLQRIKAIYVVSYYDNPRGISLVRERRAALLALAQRYSREHRIYVIEDAAYRELRFAGADQASLRAYDASADSVVYAGTFSKSFSPGLRVGFGVLPKALAPSIASLKGNIDFGSPHLNQCILSEALRRGLYEPHVELLRQVYASKANNMLAALDEHIAPLGVCSYERPAGGLYVWLTLPPELETGADSLLFARARELGVLYVPGEYCFPPSHSPSLPSSQRDDGQLSHPQQRSSMRLSFGVQSDERVYVGIQKLAAAISEVLVG